MSWQKFWQISKISDKVTTLSPRFEGFFMHYEKVIPED